MLCKNGLHEIRGPNDRDRPEHGGSCKECRRERQNAYGRRTRQAYRFEREAEGR